MKNYAELIYAIHGHQQYKFLEEVLRQTRPVIPSHDPLNDNTGQWKQRSAMQAGFDLCLSLLKINLEK